MGEGRDQGARTATKVVEPYSTDASTYQEEKSRPDPQLRSLARRRKTSSARYVAGAVRVAAMVATTVASLTYALRCVMPRLASTEPLPDRFGVQKGINVFRRLAAAGNRPWSPVDRWVRHSRAPGAYFPECAVTSLEEPPPETLSAQSPPAVRGGFGPVPDYSGGLPARVGAEYRLFGNEGVRERRDFPGASLPAPRKVRGATSWRGFSGINFDSSGTSSMFVESSNFLVAPEGVRTGQTVPAVRAGYSSAAARVLETGSSPNFGEAAGVGEHTLSSADPSLDLGNNVFTPHPLGRHAADPGRAVEDDVESELAHAGLQVYPQGVLVPPHGAPAGGPLASGLSGFASWLPLAEMSGQGAEQLEASPAAYQRVAGEESRNPRGIPDNSASQRLSQAVSTVVRAPEKQSATPTMLSQSLLGTKNALPRSKVRHVLPVSRAAAPALLGAAGSSVRADIWHFRRARDGAFFGAAGKPADLSWRSPSLVASTTAAESRGQYITAGEPSEGAHAVVEKVERLGSIDVLGKEQGNRQPGLRKRQALPDAQEGLAGESAREDRQPHASLGQRRSKPGRSERDQSGERDRATGQVAGGPPGEFLGDCDGRAPGVGRVSDCEGVKPRREFGEDLPGGDVGPRKETGGYGGIGTGSEGRHGSGTEGADKAGKARATYVPERVDDLTSPGDMASTAPGLAGEVADRAGRLVAEDQQAADGGAGVARREEEDFVAEERRETAGVPRTQRAQSSSRLDSAQPPAETGGGMTATAQPGGTVRLSGGQRQSSGRGGTEGKAVASGGRSGAGGAPGYLGGGSGGDSLPESGKGISGEEGHGGEGNGAPVGDPRADGEKKRNGGEAETKPKEDEKGDNKEIDRHDDGGGDEGEVSRRVADIFLLSEGVTASSGLLGQGSGPAERAFPEDGLVAEGRAVAAERGWARVERAATGAGRWKWGHGVKKKRKADSLASRPGTNGRGSPPPETRSGEYTAATSGRSPESQSMFPRGSWPIVAAVIGILEQQSEVADQVSATRRFVQSLQGDSGYTQIVRSAAELENRATAGGLGMNDLLELEHLERKALSLISRLHRYSIELRFAADKVTVLDKSLSGIFKSGENGVKEVFAGLKADVAMVTQQKHQLWDEAQAAQALERILRQTVATVVDIEFDVLIKANAEAAQQSFWLAVEKGVKSFSAQGVGKKTPPTEAFRAAAEAEQQEEDLGESSERERTGAAVETAARNHGRSPDPPALSAIPAAVAGLSASVVKQQAFASRAQRNFRANQTSEAALGGARQVAHITSFLVTSKAELVLWVSHYDLDSPKPLTSEEAVARRALCLIILQIEKNISVLKALFSRLKHAGLLLELVRTTTRGARP